MDGPMKHETSARCCASRSVKQSQETACLSGQHWCPIELCSSHIRPKWKPCGMPHCPQSPATLKLLTSTAFKKKYDCSWSGVNGIFVNPAVIDTLVSRTPEYLLLLVNPAVTDTLVSRTPEYLLLQGWQKLPCTSWKFYQVFYGNTYKTFGDREWTSKGRLSKFNSIETECCRD